MSLHISVNTTLRINALGRQALHILYKTFDSSVRIQHKYLIKTQVCTAACHWLELLRRRLLHSFCLLGRFREYILVKLVLYGLLQHTLAKVKWFKADCVIWL